MTKNLPAPAVPLPETGGWDLAKPEKPPKPDRPILSAPGDGPKVRFEATLDDRTRPGRATLLDAYKAEERRRAIDEAFREEMRRREPRNDDHLAYVAGLRDRPGPTYERIVDARQMDPREAHDVLKDFFFKGGGQHLVGEHFRKRIPLKVQHPNRGAVILFDPWDIGAILGDRLR